LKLLNVALLFGLFSCSNIFFMPDRYQHYAPESMGLKYRNIYFESKDKTRLHSWLFPQKETKGLVVLFHGNAQNLSSHFLSVPWLVKRGFDVWVWDYRGYGLSQGSASTEGVYEDSLAAMTFIKKLHSKRAYEKLILVGQSLGGNILMRALEDTQEQLPINLLVLDSTFPRFRSMAKSKAADIWFLWPLQPIAWSIMSDRFSGSASIEKIKVPTLVIHSRKDPVVPFLFGKEIYDRLSLSDEKKWFWPMEGVGHISTLGNSKLRKDQELIELIDSN